MEKAMRCQETRTTQHRPAELNDILNDHINKESSRYTAIDWHHFLLRKLNFQFKKRICFLHSSFCTQQIFAADILKKCLQKMLMFQYHSLNRLSKKFQELELSHKISLSALCIGNRSPAEMAPGPFIQSQMVNSKQMYKT